MTFVVGAGSTDDLVFRSGQILTLGGFLKTAFEVLVELVGNNSGQKGGDVGFDEIFGSR